MRLFNFTKPDEIQELKGRVDRADAIRQMTQTEGWVLLSKLFQEQFEAYQADLLIGCKNWDEYLDKRAKAFAIRLLLTDIEDFIRQGEDAEKELEKLTD